MSAPAVKPSIPGVGTSPSSTNHPIIPMNAMAQKVVSTTESSSMKPLTGTGLSYVTLQPPSQPLSLVQDHRPSVYQTPPYTSNNSEKEAETDKLIPNGVEITKTDSEQSVPTSVKQTESNRNNNLSPDNSTQETQKEVQAEQEITSITLEFPALCPQPQNKVEEKKTPVNNGSKEAEGIPINPTVQPKLPVHKPEEVQPKAEPQKAKPAPQSVKASGEHSTPPTPTNSPPKAETKVVTVPKANKRKSRELKDLKGGLAAADGASKPKRNRVQTQPYQSPIPEMALFVKNMNKQPLSKAPDDKLIVFYKNEFLAVRNAEGSFYVCQAMQNIYKSSRRIRIRWLSQDKNNGEIYSPDFYDYIDFDCILTNLNLNKIDKNKFQLTKIELLRTENILKRAIDVEAGVSEKPRVTEEHPDGLDLSLYKDESQLKKRRGGLHKQKQALRKKSKRTDSSSEDDSQDEDSGKKSPKPSRTKKRMVNKSLAIAKSMAKGTSRAERALMRSTKAANETSSSGSSSGASGNASTTASSATATGTGTVTAAGATNASALAADAAKGAATTDAKKSEPKKSTKQQQSNNSTSGVTRTKLRASAQNTPQSSKAAGRPKRVAAATSVQSTEEATSRKKPRGRP